MNKLLSILVGASFILAFAAGCETWDEVMSGETKVQDDDKPKYVMSVHEIVKYPRGTMIEKEVQSFGGRNVWVNINPFIHSRNIPKVEILPSKEKDGFYDLQLTLDRRGRLLWTQLSVEFNKTDVALLIDGVFYRTFQPEQLDDEEDMVVVIKGPFDPVTAKCIEKYAAKNYKYFEENKK